MLTDSQLPLAGIKVIDMSQVFMGPGAAVYLGDQGEEVIKVEPLSGDSFRWRYATPKLKQHGLVVDHVEVTAKDLCRQDIVA